MYSVILMDLVKSLLSNRSNKTFQPIVEKSDELLLMWFHLPIQPFPLLSFPMHALFQYYPSFAHPLSFVRYAGLSPTITHPVELACPSRFSSLPCLSHKDLPDCASPPSLLSSLWIAAAFAVSSIQFSVFSITIDLDWWQRSV